MWDAQLESTSLADPIKSSRIQLLVGIDLIHQETHFLATAVGQYQFRLEKNKWSVKVRRDNIN